METFSEFDQPGTAPQRNFSDIINHAFTNYFKVIGWAILLFLIYIAISVVFSFVAGPISGYDALEAQSVMTGINPEDFSDVWSSFLEIPGYKEYLLISMLFSLVMYPLFTGFVMIMHRANMETQVSFSDLFIGFRTNAFQYILFGLISSLVMFVASLLCIFPVFFALPLFFLGVPIILFENASAIEAIKKSFNTAKENYGTLLGLSFISFIIAVAGILLCGIGVLLTYPFYFAAMYSAYCAYHGTPKNISNNS